MMAKPKKPKKVKQRPKFMGPLERWLKHDGCLNSIDAGVRHVELRDLKRKRKNLQRDVPSQAWFDARWEHGVQFPPGGDETRMRLCRGNMDQKGCKRYVPTNCIGSLGICYDCYFCGLTKTAAGRRMLATMPGTCSTINLAKVKSAIRRGEQPMGGI